LNRLREIPPRQFLTGVLVLFVALSIVAAPQIEPPWVWALAATLMVATGVGAAFLSAAPVVEQNPTIGLLPTLVVLVSFVLVTQPWLTDDAVIVGFAILTGIILVGVIAGRQLPEEHRYYRAARRGILLLMYVLAFGMYTIIYMTKVRSFFTATAVALMTILVAFEMFQAPQRNVWRVGLYAIVCALIVGQVTWVLNYWVIGGLTGGAFLLLVLYSMTGVVRAYLADRMEPRLIAEYVAVLGMGFVAVAALISSQSMI
jgi:hypothetical protein